MSNLLAFGWRALLKIKHVPEQLFDVLVTPIMFTVMFTYLFGGAVAGSPDAYLNFLLPGILAQDTAGRVISAVGEVSAFDSSDQERTLGRGDNVYVGDRLTTSAEGRAQIRFVDQGLVDLRPDSVFEVVEYQESADQESGTVAMELTTGALRTITGRIGHRSDDEYEMNTDVATMGIRGTDYSLQLCTQDCADSGYPEGLYGRVDDGIVTVTNQAGMGEFTANQYFRVTGEAFMPEQLTTPPANVLDGNEDGNPASNGQGPNQGAGPPDWARGDGPPEWARGGGPPGVGWPWRPA